MSLLLLALTTWSGRTGFKEIHSPGDVHGAEDRRERETGGTHEAEFTREGKVLDAMEAVLDEVREDSL